MVTNSLNYFPLLKLSLMLSKYKLAYDNYFNNWFVARLFDKTRCSFVFSNMIFVHYCNIVFMAAAAVVIIIILHEK